MGNWVEKKVKELCIIGRGRVISQGEINSNPGIYPVFSSQTANNGEMGKIESYDFDGEYVTWTTDGANAGTVFYRSGKFNCTNVCGTLKEKENDSLDLRFFSYLLSTEAKKHVSYVGNPKLMNGVMADVKLNLPESKPEQTCIAEILSTADEAIGHTESLIAKYQRLKTGLMQDLLTKGIDENGNIRSKETHRFVVKNGIEVPEEWEVYAIGDIVEQIGSGVTPKGGSNVYIYSGVMLIRSQNVLRGEFDFSDVAFISDEINSQMRRSKLNDLDVLLNITGASIGRSHYLPIGFPQANVNQHVCIIRLSEKSLGKSLFLSTFLNDFRGQNQIKRLLGSSNREGLNFKQIREIKVCMPKIDHNDEFERIRKILELHSEALSTFKLSLNKLQSLKTGLMQDLLSGTVRVNVE